MEGKGSVACHQLMKQAGTGKVSRVELEREANILIPRQEAKIEVSGLDGQQTAIRSEVCLTLGCKIDMLHAFHIPSIV